jgi:hypothetical protein
MQMKTAGMAPVKQQSDTPGSDTTTLRYGALRRRRHLVRSDVEWWEREGLLVHGVQRGVRRDSSRARGLRGLGRWPPQPFATALSSATATANASTQLAAGLYKLNAVDHP